MKRTWIEESFNQRKYLPWRRYALVSAESTKPESDEEVWEEATPPEESSSSNNDMSDGNFPIYLIIFDIKVSYFNSLNGF